MISNGQLPHVSRRKAVSLLGLTAVAAATQRPRRASAALEPIRISGLLTEAVCPLYYGVKTGRFERAGIDVDYIASNSGAAAMAAVVSGAYEMGTSNLLSICSAHLRDMPIVVVAPQVLYTTRTREAMLQVAVNAPIRTGADLNGKTIGVPTLAGINTLAAKAWVDKNGGDPATLKFVEIPNSAQPQAIAQRRIDAGILEPPVLEASIADGTSKTIGDPMGAIASEYLIAAFVVRADWAAQHADTLKKFTRVLSESAKYVNTHSAQTAQLVSELTKIDLAVVAKMNRTLGGTSLDPGQVQPLIDAAAKYGSIPRSFPARDLFWTGAG
jgi:ABC-type nitrate/sulfonate/bicarbonate transport system substrate-binding protein